MHKTGEKKIHSNYRTVGPVFCTFVVKGLTYGKQLAC